MTGPEDLGRIIERFAQQIEAAQHVQATAQGVALVQAIATMTIVYKKTPAEIVQLFNECATALGELKLKGNGNKEGQPRE